MRALEHLVRTPAGLRPGALVALPGCLAATLFLVHAAWAQPESPGGNPPPSEVAVDGAAGEEPGGESELEAVDPSTAEAVEDFLVTSSKLELVVPDTTISVIGFDEERLKAEGIENIRDLSNFTPSLDIKSAFAASNPTIFIRGVGLDDYNANAAGAVAIYQDGVYMASPAGQLFQFFDTADVGVLRGPQPTLYRNASAGAILVRSKEPTDELDAYLSTTYGRFNEVDVEGAVGGPIVPGWLSGRLSGTWGIRDGITENRCAKSPNSPQPGVDPPNQPCLPGPGRITIISPGIDDYTNNVDRYAARGQLLFEVPVGESETRWLANAHGGKNLGRAFQYQHRGSAFFEARRWCPPPYPPGYDPNNDPNCLFHPNLSDPSSNRDALGYQDNDGDPFAGDYDIDGSEKISLWGINLNGLWSFGDAYEISTLSAYEWHDRSTRE